MKNLFCCLALILQACATNVTPTGPVFSKHSKISNDESIVYFYQQNFKGAMYCLLIAIDDDIKECLGYPGYAKISIKPGKRNVSFIPNSPIKISNSNFDFDFEPGKAYYFSFKEIYSNQDPEKPVVSFYNSLLMTSYGWFEVSEYEALKFLPKLKAWGNLK